ncbi:Alpha/Beta hydrolase protein [Podospora didyma]|uniref:Carboxylic ester hydrolase n=1 Tax=Podospora didyma TaxID=330526 RepID=A0AAE0KAG0_9PEZI|nr:Alpha/Beta hydrolase protein [Podospora didyma]
MRYAAPPVGDLRWRAPVEPPHTDGVTKAIWFRSICLGINTAYPNADHDEDCLFANVWAPTGATAESKLPVWIFFPGGGYVAITNANWNGAEVVEKSGHNIVLVNFNYRVGLWGFLASERVRADGDLNLGLLDQRRLMAWVKTHIASFGGDPDHVVIHGASAGAGSVAMHMVAHGGRNDNLFIGAMAESLFFPAQPFVSELEYQFDRVVRQTGCDGLDPSQQMACLRSKPAGILQAVNFAQSFPGRLGGPMPLFYWTPCIDGDFIQDLPYRMFREGKYVDVPLLFGTTTDEGSYFAADAGSPADVTTFLANNYPQLRRKDMAAILDRYPKLAPVQRHREWFPTASQAYGEATFVCPTVNVLNAVQHRLNNHTSDIIINNNNNITTTTNTNTNTPLPATSKSVFAYRYNVVDADNLAAGYGVPHIFEAAAIFGPNNIGGAAASYYGINAPVVPLMMSYWISFVRALNPNIYRQVGSPAWEAWGGESQRLVFETGGPARMETTPTEELERCQFWLGLGKTMEQKKMRL